MSTIEPNTQSIVIPSHIGKRIIEIMEEKGKAYSQAALAIRIGMNRETIRKKLRGERDLYLFELRRIAEVLHLSVDRILQEDTRDDENTLKRFFDSFSNSNVPSNSDGGQFLVLETAQKLSGLAVGITEKSKALNDLGRVYFLFQRYGDAHRTWLKALDYSKSLVKKYGDRERYLLILSNILIVSTVLDEYMNMDSSLDEIASAFHSDPHKMGVVYYVRAKMAEKAKNITLAKTFAYKSLECFISTEVLISIGRAEKTVAHYEFVEGNYQKAKLLLENAMENLSSNTSSWLNTVVDYAKTLIKLGMIKDADTLLRSVLNNSVDSIMYNFNDTIGKLKILLSASSGDLQYAESVLVDTRVSVIIRHLAFKYLKKESVRSGDENSLMKYTILEEGLGIGSQEILDEEVL